VPADIIAAWTARNSQERMTPTERRKRVRLEILTATTRLEWAIKQERQAATPALARFISDSRLECRKLREKLTQLERQAKIKKLSKAGKISK